MSQRSSTAFETLFTFWPPGPDARTARNSISSSGIASVGVISSGTAPNRAGGGGGHGCAIDRRDHLDADLALRHGNRDAVLP